MRFIVPVALLIALGSCAVAERAEAVFFRYQRALTALTTVMLAREAQDLEVGHNLYDTETELLDACESLWEAARRRLDRSAIDDALKWDIYRALDECTERTRETEDLLWKIDPQIARRYLEERD